MRNLGEKKEKHIVSNPLRLFCIEKRKQNKHLKRNSFSLGHFIAKKEIDQN